MKKDLSFVTTIFGGAVTAIFSTLAIPVIALFVSEIADYISGVLAAFYTGEALSPSKGVKGIAKKIALWLVVFTGLIIDIMMRYGLEELGIDISLKYLTSPIIAIWLTCNELLSILQNLGKMNVPMPKFLQPLIDSLLKEVEQK